MGSEPAHGPDDLWLQHDGRTIARVSRSEFALPALPIANRAPFERMLQSVERRVRQDPVNATIGNYGEIVPERVGRRVDAERLEDLFNIYYYSAGASSFEVPLTPIFPKVDGELLAFIREKAIGQYVTYFNAGNRNRAHNISLAAKSINNTVVFPNETFSFNRIVGPRSPAKGYLQAPVIVRGELSEGIGGGICQVSSTLFNAVDRAGLRVVKRYSHSRHVPYVLPGRDATVSWGGPDFVFENQYNQPVLIRAFAGHGQMFVSIYSSDVIDYRPRTVSNVAKKPPEEISFVTDAKQR